MQESATEECPSLERVVSYEERRDAFRAAVDHLRWAVAYHAKAHRNWPKTAAAERSNVILEKAAMGVVDAGHDWRELLAGERLANEALREVKPGSVRPSASLEVNDNCRRDHGASEQRVTPKGVRYCRQCYRDAREAREKNPPRR